jgi:hypothetical protein
MKHAGSHRPSAALVVAIIALVVAVSGSALAAEGVISGDSLIKKRTLSGDRLRPRTLTGAQINLRKLGEVPIAALAVTAANADMLGGRPPSSYMTSSGTSGAGRAIVRASATASGSTVALLSSGPFTLTMTCTAEPDGGTSVTLFGSSSENNADLDDTFVSANTPTDLITPDISDITGPYAQDGMSLSFEAPSGAQLVITGGDGVNSLGSDCWANFAPVP